MEISALTRSVVKSTHAIISPDGYVNSQVPGWTNCTVNVIISEQMGARLCQTLITLNAEGRLTGETGRSQLFFYVISGSCKIIIDSTGKTVKAGQYVYIPAASNYVVEQSQAGTQLLSFHKVYESLEGHAAPTVVCGEVASVAAPPLIDDPALRLQVLLPDNLSFDMAVNILTYDPGAHLPFVETHIMEHGLMYLQGQGIYMLDHQWYPVKKGDSIWMAPYCQQWFTAMGKEPAVYIYYKNVNRLPFTI
jgi:(S)-ureidoglycine aminohydrolase